MSKDDRTHGKQLIRSLHRFAVQVQFSSAVGGAHLQCCERGHAAPRQIKAAAVEVEEPWEPWEGFQGDLARWARDSAFGLAAGFVFGWVKGLRDNVHLQGKFGPGESSVYRGIKYSFRVPLNYIQASISCASWGLRVGLFTSAFSAFTIYVHREKISPPSLPASAWVGQALGLEAGGEGASEQLADKIVTGVLPFSAAGTTAGAIYGWFRGQGALRSTLAGGVLGLTLTSSLKALEIYLHTTILPDVERKLQELREEEERRKKTGK